MEEGSLRRYVRAYGKNTEWKYSENYRYCRRKYIEFHNRLIELLKEKWPWMKEN